jgi:hypothetical protein
MSTLSGRPARVFPDFPATRRQDKMDGFHSDAQGKGAAWTCRFHAIARIYDIFLAA